ncbi:MAG: hypothetical protein KF763_08215 [Cyclobacteriaceae bacterium]|nr:hypothetical protein [Cyclobacteriaceae bacterium]
MKKHFFLIILTINSFIAKGQWTTNGNNIYNSNTGYVGIGTSEPLEKLHIVGSLGIGKFTGHSYTGLQILYTDGGHGTTTFKHQRWGGDFYFKRNSSAGERTQFYFEGDSNHRIDIYNNANQVNIRFNSDGVSFLNGGNVGIGTATPGSFKLAVAGKIAANEEVRVFIAGTSVFPDYVFNPGYQLPNLEETEKYIKENRHLPEVPSATEIEKEGMSLNQMNILLLKKVEELTLYLIEIKKENKELKERIENIEAKK